MLFVDLKNLKIIKEFHFNTVEKKIDFDLTKPIKSQADALKPLFDCVIAPSPLAVQYVFTIEDEGNATVEETEDFLAAVNAIIGVFFASMITEDGRRREHRFDVPDKLMATKVNRSTLKKAINYATINDTFNLIIKYKDLVYIMCDEKEFKEEQPNA